MSYWRGLTYNGSLLTYGDHTLAYYPSADMNPYNLPPWTIRIEYAFDTHGPIIPSLGFPQTHVDNFGNGNVWDVSLAGENHPDYWFNELFRTNEPDDNPHTVIRYKLGDPNLKRVLGAYAPGLTNLSGMFANCHNLREVCLFDTRYVKQWDSTFGGCTSLKYLSRFDVSSAVGMNFMCADCLNVTGGALDLYNDASSTGLVSNHYRTFAYCGKNTTTGSAELAQIPNDWKYD